MNRFRIGVVTLRYGEEYEAADNLVAGYITAVLRENGFRVDMLEIEESKEHEGLETLILPKYAIIFFAIPTTSNIPELMRFSMTVKQHSPACMVVLTGWDHHSAPIEVEQIMEACPYIDIIVRGEGEITAVALAQCIAYKKTLADCAGITYRERDTIVRNPERSLLTDLDSLPFPARDNNRHQFQTMRISSARGCCGNCTFCPVPTSRQEGQPPWRGRSAENVVAEISQIVDNYNVRHFMFIDPTFEDPGAVGKQRIAEIAKRIIETGLDIQFLVNMRAENWTQVDRPLLELLCQAGLESVTVGIESGSKRSLQLFNKSAGIADFYRFTDLMDQMNIFLAYGFIMFHPYSEFEDLEQNNRFLYDAGIGYMMGAYFIRLKAFPKTQIYLQMKRDHLLYSSSAQGYSLYDYHFKNREVAKLANKMSAVSDNQAQKPEIHYYNIQKITTFISRMNRKIQKEHDNNNKLLMILHPLQESLAALKIRLNQQNYKWFVQCIQWAKSNGSDEEFREIENRHNEILLCEYQSIKNLQIKCGKKLFQEMR